MSTRRTDDDFSAELEAHLALEIDRLVADGMTREEARAAALRAFGSPTRAREQFYERSRWMWLEQFGQDVRYAWRGLRAHPAFLATTVGTLAVGLSLLTVAFTVFNAYVLRPFAVSDPSRLYRLAWRTQDAVAHSFGWRQYEELRGRTDVFDAVIGGDMRFVRSDGRTLVAAAVSPNYFTVLRPRTLLGRALGPGDAGQRVAVLGQQAWSRLFGADPGILGRTIDLEGSAATIVGVMREEFGGLDDFPRDLWFPANAAEGRDTEVIVRLRAGLNPVQAEARLGEWAARMTPPKLSPRDARAVLVPNATANTL